MWIGFVETGQIKAKT